MQYSLLSTDGMRSDHDVMHVQFSSGAIIWQRVLKRLMNTYKVHGWRQQREQTTS